MRGLLFFALMLFPALVMVADAFLVGPRSPGIAAIVAVDSTPRLGTVGQSIQAPLEVRVIDAAGNGVSGVRVLWAPGLVGGTMAPLTSTTDDRGVASSQWTLGTLAGPYATQAIVSRLNDSAVTFRALALPESVSTVLRVPVDSNETGPGDTVRLVAADRYGNRVAGATLAWRFGRSGAPGSVVSAESGLVSIPLVSETDSLILTSAGLEIIVPPATAPAPPDAATWFERAAGVPPARIGHALVFDPTNQNAVLFGGTATDVYRDMWLWTADGWNEARPANIPPGRINHAMAFDGTGVVMFGGLSGTTVLDDLWRWDGRDWTEITSRGPAGRYGHAMARDEASGIVVLFGGIAGPTVGFSDTWTWDGTSWRQVSTALTPSSRLGHTMVHDASRQRIVLFGGRASAGGTLLNDTWEYTGNSWNRIPTPVTPPGLVNHAMTFDRVRGRVVLFGGRTATGPVNGTWEFDGLSWSQRLTTAQPEPRESATVFYDVSQGLTILYGGGAATQFSDTWEYRIP